MKTLRRIPLPPAYLSRWVAAIAAAASSLLNAAPADGVKIRSRDELIDGVDSAAGKDEGEFRTGLDEPLADYIEAVRLIQRGHALRDEGKIESAMPSYRQALRNLERIERRYPDWCKEMRSYRQSQCQEIIGAVGRTRAGKVLTISDTVGESLPRGPKIIGRGPHRDGGGPAAPQADSGPAAGGPVVSEVGQDSAATGSTTAPAVTGAEAGPRPMPGQDGAPAEPAGAPFEESLPTQLATLQQHLEAVIRDRDALKSRNAILERELESIGARLEQLERELATARAQPPAAAAPPPEAAGAAEPVSAEFAAAPEEDHQRLAEAQAAHLRMQLQKEREIATLRATLARALAKVRELDPAAAADLEAGVRPAPPAP